MNTCRCTDEKRCRPCARRERLRLWYIANRKRQKAEKTIAIKNSIFAEALYGGWNYDKYRILNKAK